MNSSPRHTARLHGATAALAPAGTGAMGQVAGYTPADYLHQHTARCRRAARVPASTWDAALDHVRDPDDATRLADSAQGRLLYQYAIPLYRHAADAGDKRAAYQLAELLAGRDDLEGLRGRADAGDKHAARKLADLLADRGDLKGLRACADARDPGAAFKLAGLLAGQGDLDELSARADAGDRYAAKKLDELGDLEDLRARAAAGDGEAASHLTSLLAARGELEELRARADAGDWAAANELAGLLVEWGRPGPSCTGTAWPR